MTSPVNASPSGTRLFTQCAMDAEGAEKHDRHENTREKLVDDGALRLISALLDHLAERVAERVIAALQSEGSGGTRGVPALLTLGEASALLRRSPREVRRLAAAGEIRACRVGRNGRRILIDREDLLTAVRRDNTDEPTSVDARVSRLHDRIRRAA